RTHGITKDSSEYINESHGPWYHEQQDLGYNYRITDIQCALGISQLEKIDKFLGRRREIVKEYNQAFNDFEGVIIPEQLKNTNSAWHLYVIQIELEKLIADRKEIFKALREKKLGVNVHYIPVYYHPYYKDLGYEKGICPNAERMYERIITIPLYPKMTDQQVEEVINRTKVIIEEYYHKEI
ncbi:MAG: DegT/DnrJ/EryC1/StrS family aminotransferase, partial [Bacillota bacterium]